MKDTLKVSLAIIVFIAMLLAFMYLSDEKDKEEIERKKQLDYKIFQYGYVCGYNAAFEADSIAEYYEIMRADSANLAKLLK